MIETTKDPAQNTGTRTRNSGKAGADFKDDPLIRDALEIFKGEIKPVTE